jgi:hypothetical protein
VCFLKWEDFIQKRRKLPAWRVFAVAASADELEALKTSLHAQWDEWGAKPGIPIETLPADVRAKLERIRNRQKAR